MRKISGLYYFYQKIIFPASMLSALLSFLLLYNESFLKGIGISLAFLIPVCHYLVYEISYPQEYYFYYNLGFSRLNLWIYTAIMSLTMVFIFSMV